MGYSAGVGHDALARVSQPHVAQPGARVEN
jgi:hypothetical protein